MRDFAGEGRAAALSLPARLLYTVFAVLTLAGCLSCSTGCGCGRWRRGWPLRMTNRDKGFRRSARRGSVCRWPMIRFKALDRAGALRPAPSPLRGPRVMTQIRSTRSGKETECDDFL